MLKDKKMSLYLFLICKIFCILNQLRIFDNQVVIKNKKASKELKDYVTYYL